MSDRVIDLALSVLVLVGAILWVRAARLLWRGESKWKLPRERQRPLAVWLTVLVALAYSVLLWSLWFFQ